MKGDEKRMVLENDRHGKPGSPCGVGGWFASINRTVVWLGSDRSTVT